MSEERPFGRLYTEADYRFFRERNLDMDRSRTPEEEITTEQHIRGIDERFFKAEEERSEALIEKITNRGIEVRRARSSDPDKLFVLTSDPIDLCVVQQKSRTTILFQPDPNMEFDPFYFYNLFLVELPKSIYGTGEYTPPPTHIANSTEITVSTVSKKTKKFNLRTPSAADDFEEIMEEPEKINAVLLQCIGEGVAYSLILPNPKKSDKYVQFAFPSMYSLKSGTVDLLFRLHKDGQKLNSNNKSYAEAFTDSINFIREDLRVK